MQEWTEVKFDDAKIFKSEGISVHMIVSPYDIPEGIRGFFDNDKERFVIEFKYIGDEPTEDRQEDKHYALRVGQNSGRLYAIEINVHELKAKSVSLQVGVILKEVARAFDKLASKPLNAKRSLNYRLARNAVITTKDLVMPAAI